MPVALYQAVGPAGKSGSKLRRASEISLTTPGLDLATRLRVFQRALRSKVERRDALIDIVRAVNTTLELAVLSGLSGSTALAYPPTIRVSGDFASGWTLTFDDGFGGPGEPDFNDVVVLIKATP